MTYTAAYTCVAILCLQHDLGIINKGWAVKKGERHTLSVSLQNGPRFISFLTWYPEAVLIVVDLKDELNFSSQQQKRRKALCIQKDLCRVFQSQQSFLINSLVWLCLYSSETEQYVPFYFIRKPYVLNISCCTNMANRAYLVCRLCVCDMNWA